MYSVGTNARIVLLFLVVGFARSHPHSTSSNSPNREDGELLVNGPSRQAIPGLGGRLPLTAASNALATPHFDDVHLWRRPAYGGGRGGVGQTTDHRDGAVSGKSPRRAPERSLGNRDATGAAAKRVKREWDDSVIAWIKRTADGHLRGMSADSSDSFNVDDGTKAMQPKEYDDRERRGWDDGDLAWLKRHWRPDTFEGGEDRNSKRDWDDSVIAWIKRSVGNGDYSHYKTVGGRAGSSSGDVSVRKRMWDNHELAWLK